MNGVRFRNPSDLEEYQKYKVNLEPYYIEVERLTLTNQMEEFMFLGLRRMDGISKREFKRRFGYFLESVYGEVIKKWEKEGLLEETEDRIWLTQKGIDVSNVVLADFLFE